MEPFKLRARCSFKSIPILEMFNPETTLNNFYEVISSIVEMGIEEIKVLHGYPPKLVKGSRTSTLKDIGLKSGENIFIEKKKSSDPSCLLGNSEASSETKPVAVPQSSCTSTEESLPSAAPKQKDVAVVNPPGIFFTNDSDISDLCKKEVPSDGSCLFASIDYILNGNIEASRVKDLRKLVVSSLVSPDNEIPDDVFIGQTKKEYCDSILQDSTWGGEIDLSVLSKHYRMEIIALNVVTNTVTRFSETAGFSVCCYIIYTGIHYDPVHMPAPGIEGFFYSTFPSTSLEVFTSAIKMLNLEHKSGKYVDVLKMLVVCGDCGLKFIGNKAALAHATATKHTNFTQVHSN